jgi:hypothetical protein
LTRQRLVLVKKLARWILTAERARCVALAGE